LSGQEVPAITKGTTMSDEPTDQRPDMRCRAAVADTHWLIISTDLGIYMANTKAMSMPSTNRCRHAFEHDAGADHRCDGQDAKRDLQQRGAGLNHSFYWHGRNPVAVRAAGLDRDLIGCPSTAWRRAAIASAAIKRRSG
jgi:hypothetical protein